MRRGHMPVLRERIGQKRALPRLREGREVAVARAIWKGKLVLTDHEVPVKMYSAVQDRKIHFRLLHAPDLVPIEQRIVRKTDGKSVAKEDRRKAFPLDRDTGVIIQPDELEALQPEASREIHLCRFVPPSAIGDQWYDRPYYVGPDKDDKAYFAFAQALERGKVTGVARWVMRKRRYVGALSVADGYLMMITLRRAEQVLSVSRLDISESRMPDAKELRLAQHLVSSIAADFEPELWQDQYRQRVHDLIRTKASGKAVRLVERKRKRAAGGLSEQLRESIAQAKEKKVA